MIGTELVIAIGGPILGTLATAIGFLYREVIRVKNSETDCQRELGRLEGRQEMLERRLDKVERNGR